MEFPWTSPTQSWHFQSLRGQLIWFLKCRYKALINYGNRDISMSKTTANTVFPCHYLFTISIFHFWFTFSILYYTFPVSIRNYPLFNIHYQVPLSIIHCQLCNIPHLLKTIKFRSNFYVESCFGILTTIYQHRFTLLKHLFKNG